MKNIILVLTLALFFSFNLTGCSLFSSSDDEQETATVAEDQVSDGDEFASDDFEDGDDEDADFGDDEGDGESVSVEKAEDIVADDMTVEDNFGEEDDYPDDDYSGDSDAKIAEKTSDDDFFNDDDFSSDDTFVVDEGGGLPDSTMTANQEDDLFGSDSEPVVDTPSFADNFSDSGSSFMEPVSDVPKFVSVKKMKPASYTRAGANVNRLYVVRSGDTMGAIAQKIYGSSGKESDLYAYNSHFQGKSLNVGDKIYYSSPNNPNDPSMVTYYEDNNMSPQYYTSQDGDNIRRISKKLLGHERSWMEVYATNINVESKGRLPSGLQLRYWPDGASTPIAIAQNSPEPEPPVVDEPIEPEVAEPEEIQNIKMEEPQEIAQLEEPTPMEDPMESEAEMAPPPVAASMNEPPKAIAPPPPPPPAPRAQFNKPAPPEVGAVDNESGLPLAGIGEDSTIMAALGGLLILAFIIMMIFIRRSRSKRVNFSQTQV